ncbi:hypothetical protein GQ651_17675 [Alphaproteobacteria bacterium GH1-50]|uniref:Uncharacterized protein n=1 Tax=Kangsaoukella pontilimi TaxID=2691042 RepID=A0A7C9N327_9RHOB|nr:hypothetical protein [Kangsaoukella pontilimi]MXQ09678.1 hypothetical protein [Kangsaoukella pontilimi]
MGFPGVRYAGAALTAFALAFYATVFARQTHDLFDLPTWIDLTEWPATLLFLASSFLAWVKQPRRAALAVVLGLFAFLAAQHGYIFNVPLGFVLVTVFTIAVLIVLPASLRGK